ncbi:MAG: flagellar basal body-associated FliL family protein [Lachnospiraceae bacterium]|nr:flagellar basal body-associated FliL family protein [Lachnospiraceae bacterium]
MKKNLLSVVILALLIVNLILTSIMMFSVMNTNKKTGAVVADIAAILQIELGTDAEGGGAHQVSLEDTATFDLTNDLTISLKKGADDKEHFAMVNVSISMDTKSDGYKTFGENIADRESLIVGVVTDVISSYTVDELEPFKDQIKDEILKQLQQKFDGSDFIYDITFTKLIPS